MNTHTVSFDSLGATHALDAVRKGVSHLFRESGELARTVTCDPAVFDALLVFLGPLCRYVELETDRGNRTVHLEIKTSAGTVTLFPCRVRDQAAVQLLDKNGAVLLEITGFRV